MDIIQTNSVNLPSPYYNSSSKLSVQKQDGKEDVKDALLNKTLHDSSVGNMPTIRSNTYLNQDLNDSKSGILVADGYLNDCQLPIKLEFIKQEEDNMEAEVDKLLGVSKSIVTLEVTEKEELISNGSFQNCNNPINSNTHDNSSNSPITVGESTTLSNVTTSPISSDISSKTEVKLTNNSKGLYTCSYCSFSNVLLRCLRDHQRTEHYSMRNYAICYICNKTVTHKNVLKKHCKIVHGSKKFQCSECDFTTKHARSLESHMQYHTGTLQELCYICGFQNANTRSMDTHIQRHSGIKSESCNLCNYRFTTKASLIHHLSSHKGDRQYFCDICNHRTHRLDYLKRHKASMHSNIKPNKCDICDYAGLNPTALKNHKKTHVTNREPHICSVCGKQYLRSRSLKQHQLTHSNVKVFTCTLCSGSFASGTCLDAHMKLHTGEGRMFCLECKYSSINKANFIQHVNKTCIKARHAKDNLMHCYRCGYSSNHRSNFINHVSKICSKLKRKGTSKLRRK